MRPPAAARRAVAVRVGAAVDARRITPQRGDTGHAGADQGTYAFGSPPPWLALDAHVSPIVLPDGYGAAGAGGAFRSASGR